MHAIYVGDSNNIVKRIKTNHVSDNVEGSPLRQRVAEEWGWALTKQRLGRRRKIRLDMTDQHAGEALITKYLRSGHWRMVICDSYPEAHDFQWYCIKALAPLLNHDSKDWDPRSNERYQLLFKELSTRHELSWEDLKSVRSGPGVYVFYHNEEPKTWITQYDANTLAPDEQVTESVSHERTGGSRRWLNRLGLMIVGVIAVVVCVWIVQKQLGKQSGSCAC